MTDEAYKQDRILRTKLWVLVSSGVLVTDDERLRSFDKWDCSEDEERRKQRVRELENRGLAKLLPDSTEEQRNEKFRTWEQQGLWPMHPFEILDNYKIVPEEERAALAKRRADLAAAIEHAKTDLASCEEAKTDMACCEKAQDAAKGFREMIERYLGLFEKELASLPDPNDQWWN